MGMATHVGALVIDEEGRRFKVDGLKAKKKTGALGKAAKGTAALMTMGLSVAAEKAMDAFGGEWFSFDELVGGQELVDDRRETVRKSGGSLVRIARGLSVGDHTSKTQSKMVRHACTIRIQLDRLKEPFIDVPIQTEPLSGAAYEKADRMRFETLNALRYIKSH